MNVGDLKRYLAEHEFDDEAPVLLRTLTGGNFVQRAATAGRRPGDGGLILSVDMDVHAMRAQAREEAQAQKEGVAHG